MKKIGILTLHFGANYGGTLQCLALSRLLQQRGCEVEVIDFRPRLSCGLVKKMVLHASSARSLADLRRVIKPAARTAGRAVSPALCRVFDAFRAEHLTLSAPCDERSIGTVCSRYDAVVVGSDQVWSSTIRSHLTYFADWQPPFAGRLYSYAACAVTLRYPLVRRWRLRRLLGRFSVISVRDGFSARFVRQFLPQAPVRIDLDPTQVYDFADLAAPPVADDDYIFVYVLGSDISGGNAAAISRLKELTGCRRVVAVSVYGRPVPYADETLLEASPAEWVSALRHARFVFTDSFHAEVFALKFQKDFCVYYAEAARASRILALSGQFDAMSHVATAAADITALHGPANIPDRFNKLRHAAENYLDQIAQ